jgi:hypothetical protein
MQRAPVVNKIAEIIIIAFKNPLKMNLISGILHINN